MAKDEVTMHVGNGSKVDVIAVGTIPLLLPLELVIDLNNCYLVPALSDNPQVYGIATAFEGRVFDPNLKIRHKGSQRIFEGISS